MLNLIAGLLKILNYKNQIFKYRIKIYPSAEKYILWFFLPFECHEYNSIE